MTSEPVPAGQPPFELEPDATDTEATMISNRTHPTVRHMLGQPSEPGPRQCECWLHYTTTQIAENDEKHTCTECGDEW